MLFALLTTGLNNVRVASTCSAPNSVSHIDCQQTSPSTRSESATSVLPSLQPFAITFKTLTRRRGRRHLGVATISTLPVPISSMRRISPAASSLEA